MLKSGVWILPLLLLVFRRDTFCTGATPRPTPLLRRASQDHQTLHRSVVGLASEMDYFVFWGRQSRCAGFRIPRSKECLSGHLE